MTPFHSKVQPLTLNPKSLDPSTVLPVTAPHSTKPPHHWQEGLLPLKAYCPPPMWSPAETWRYCYLPRLLFPHPTVLLPLPFSAALRNPSFPLLVHVPQPLFASEDPDAKAVLRVEGTRAALVVFLPQQDRGAEEGSISELRPGRQGAARAKGPGVTSACVRERWLAMVGRGTDLSWFLCSALRRSRGS